jgi:hypothetical protein
VGAVRGWRYGAGLGCIGVWLYSVHSFVCFSALKQCDIHIDLKGRSATIHRKEN